MAATGTIALNANSLSVTGSGTKFTTEAQVGGALVTYIGNVPYTFVVGAINSNTSITLTANYQGSNVSGQSFSLIDRGAYTAITAELGARTAQAIRGLNYDKANWQQILTGSGNVTVNVPDGSQYTGPSWLSLANSLSGINDSLSKKANSADLGNAAKKNIGSVAGTVAAGDDVRFKQGAMEGGTVTYANGSPVGSGAYSTAVLKLTYSDVDAYNVLLYGSGNNKNGFNAVIRAAWGDTMAYYQFNANGNAYAPAQWVSNSDSRIKDNINKISEPLSKMTTIRGVTWDRKDGYSPGVGFIAQSVQREFAENVFVAGDRELTDGTLVKGILSPDTTGVSAALHQEAILTLMSIQRKALLALSDPSLSDEDKQSALKELATLIPDESEYADQ